MAHSLNPNAHGGAARVSYVGSGARDYGARPVPPYRRGQWEFQLIASGRCAVTFPGDEPALEAPARGLWVFTPECVHGWGGGAGKGCEVAVLHFDRAPASLVRRLGGRAWARVEVSAEEARTVVALAREAPRFWDKPTEVRELHVTSLLARLALLVLDKEPSGVMERPGAWRKVDQAQAWWRAHLHEGPSLAEVARAVGVSRQHLRRLFHEARGQSPRQALAALRLERATELLRGTELKQEAIAQACGYSCAAAFSRAYFVATSTRPGDVRRE